MTLTKRDLTVRIAGKTNFRQQDVKLIVQGTMDCISEALVKGDKVELRNFGVFEIQVRKPRIGRNPRAPEKEFVIPQRPVIKFKSGKELTARLNRAFQKSSRRPAQPRK